MQYQYIDLPNNEKIHYRIENQNSNDEEVIVLLHGNFSSLGWWDQTILMLKPTLKKIVAPDLRGFGRSSYKNKCYKFGDWAKDVVQLMHLLKIKNAILIGWSFGGAISQKVSQLAPEIVSKLILTCSVSHQGLPVTNEQGKPCKTIQQIVQIPRYAAAIGVLATGNKQAMYGIFDMLLYKRMGHVNQQRKAQLASDPFNQRCYPQLLAALANSDINVQSIKAKTLLIHGTQDTVLPVQTILGTAGKLGKIEVWEEHAHMIPIEDTKRYVEAIINFVK